MILRRRRSRNPQVGRSDQGVDLTRSSGRVPAVVTSPTSAFLHHEAEWWAASD